MLSREIATQMRGRALTWEMFPFSFREFLDFKGISSEDNLPTKQRLTIQHAFGEYWQSGGFPEVAGVDRQLRIMTHQAYWGAMLFRDLIERQDRSRMFVQVCESMAEPQTRKQEVVALCEAMAELQLTEGIIVTLNEEELIQTESGRIAVVPAWRFLLNIS